PRAVTARFAGCRANRPRDVQGRAAYVGDRCLGAGASAPALGNDHAISDRGATGVVGLREMTSWRAASFTCAVDPELLPSDLPAPSRTAHCARGKILGTEHLP